MRYGPEEFCDVNIWKQKKFRRHTVYKSPLARMHMPGAAVVSEQWALIDITAYHRYDLNDQHGSMTERGILDLSSA